jgi:Uma2 family endonuclease
MATMSTSTFTLGPEFDLLLDDTEESLVGASYHQGNMTQMYDGLILCGPERGLPWFVGNQITLVIPRQGEHPAYQPSPDILVHPTLGEGERTSLNLIDDGPPALIIEVASPSTAADHDLNLTSPRGKPAVYERIGVLEYLVFDPIGQILPRQVRAWRRGATGYEPWEPEGGTRDSGSGRWHSEALGVSFAPQGLWLRLDDQEGRLVSTIREMHRERQRLSDVNRAQADELARLRAELLRLRGE